MANENFDKVYNYLRENYVFDRIDMDVAEDHDGQMYFIMSSWKGIEDLAEEVRIVLEIDEDEKINIDELLDCEVVFDDEYTTCSDCHKIIRTSPDSYHWQPEYYLGDGFIVCKECFDNNGYVEDYIEERINEPKNAINGMVSREQLEVRGFRKANDDAYENGYHRGQTDDSQVIYEDLRESYDEVIFLIDSVGQFDMHFSAYVRNERDVVGR